MSHFGITCALRAGAMRIADMWPLISYLGLAEAPPGKPSIPALRDSHIFTFEHSSAVHSILGSF